MSQPPAALAKSPASARTRRLVEGPITSTLLRLAMLNVGVMMARAAVSTCEVYFIGWLGTEALAGASLVFPLVMLMYTMSAGGMGGGVASAVARALGGSRPGRGHYGEHRALWRNLSPPVDDDVQHRTRGPGRENRILAVCGTDLRLLRDGIGALLRFPGRGTASLAARGRDHSVGRGRRWGMGGQWLVWRRPFLALPLHRCGLCAVCHDYGRIHLIQHLAGGFKSTRYTAIKAFASLALETSLPFFVFFHRGSR